MNKTITLYHGTTPEHAERLLKDGWAPNCFSSGANGGDPRFLYLTNFEENARWFSNQKGCDVVLSVEVLVKNLAVDPHDSTFETVEEELNSRSGFPAYLVTKESLSNTCFKLVKGTK